MRTRNQFELAGSSDYWNLNYYINFQGKKCGSLRKCGWSVQIKQMFELWGIQVIAIDCVTI